MLPIEKQNDHGDERDASFLQDMAQLSTLYANNHLSDVLFVFPSANASSTSRTVADPSLNEKVAANEDEEHALHDDTSAPEHHLLPAHRLVLALRSGAFNAAFHRAKSSQVPSQIRFPIKIQIHDASYDVFVTLIKFLYTNQVSSEVLDKKSDDLKALQVFWKDLLRAAYVYLVPSLVEICVQRIIALWEISGMKNQAADRTQANEIKQLKKIFEILVFSDEVLATRQIAGKQRTQRRKTVAADAEENGECTDQNGSTNTTDEANPPCDDEACRGLSKCTASIGELQQICMEKLQQVPDHQFEALVHSDVGRRCSTERICDILRQRSKNPLVVAIRHQLGRVVNELLKSGEPLDKTTEDEQELPLVAALSTGNDAIVRRLLVDEDAPFFLLTDKIPLLLLACANGSVLHCRILIEKSNEDVNLISPLQDGDKEILAQFGRRQTPLQLASRGGHAGVTRLLLEHHAVSNLQDEEGNTALHGATNMETAEVLLSPSFKTNPNIPNRRGQTPLHVAATRGNVGIVDLLLRHGAEKDIVDDQGQTAFHVAAANGHTSVALVLLHENERIPAPRTNDKQKTTASAHDQENGTMQQQAGGSTDDTVATEASAEPTSAPIEEEMPRRFDINQEDLKGNTALHLAAMSPSERCQKMIQLLLENGADPNHANWFGYTPLHLFCSHQSGPASVIDIFIEHGVNIHSQSLDGSTALHMAVGRASESVAVSLVIAGAHVHLQDAAGRTVVDLAESTNQGAMLVPVLRNLAHAPDWVADDQVQDCSSCHVAFGVAMRKHHCRHCGRIICYNCSSNKLPIPKFQLPKPSRVCDTCFDVLSFRRLL